MAVATTSGTVQKNDETNGSIWHEARTRLSKDVKTLFCPLLPANGDQHQILHNVLASVKQKEKDCSERRLKVIWKGRSIVLRDVFAKVTCCVQKFIAVGDIIVQIDPVHAALPWAAIRFFFQAAVNDNEIYGCIVQSIEQITNLLVRCAALEALYLSMVNTDLIGTFRKALVNLYVDVLSYLAKVLQYYNQNKLQRKLKGIISTPKDIEYWTSSISIKEIEVERIARLIEAQRSQDIANSVEYLVNQQGQETATLKQKEDKLYKLLADLQAPLIRIDTRLAELHDDLEMQNRTKILKAISTVPYPVHHRTISKNRLQGSGEWLSERPIFKHWQSESSSSVLWLHGIPGSGKTHLISLVVDMLQSTTHLAYFYCMRNPAEPERSKCNKILACLVRQLASVDRKAPILVPVKQRYEDALEGFEGFEDQSWTAKESADMLVELTKIYPSITLVLDALDEVDTSERRNLMDELDRIIKESEGLVKVFISSRDSMDIVWRLAQSPNHYISAQDNAQDIKSFISDRLDAARLLHGKITKELRERIERTLIQGASGMFRWVELQIQSLAPLKVAADIEDSLGQLPRTLGESYWAILRQINDSGKHAAKLAMRTLQWLLYARESIKIDAFAKLLSVHSHGALYTGDQILDVCSSLIIKDEESSFRFSHLSVREFLEQALLQEDINELQVAEGNASIASTCLLYLKNAFSKKEMLAAPLNKASKVRSKQLESEDDSHSTSYNHDIEQAWARLARIDLDVFQDIKECSLDAVTEQQMHAALSEKAAQWDEAQDYAVKHWVDHVTDSEDLKYSDPLKSEVLSFLVSRSSGYRCLSGLVSSSDRPSTFNCPDR